MYDYRVFYGNIVKGDLISAIDYLKKFPSRRLRLNRYIKVFEKAEPIVHSKNKVVNDICQIFDTFYRMVFYLKEDYLKCVQYLCDAFGGYLNVPCQEYTSIEEAADAFDKLEEKLAKLVENEGYHYLGGITSGAYGPYIWKTTKRKNYKVKLPHTTEAFPLDMMTGFVSRSWMSHISFGKIGTGGWAGSDGVLCCVKKSYRWKMLTSGFKINFLKHEAQHELDYRQYPNITSTQLEYRAKLVQLIYAKEMKVFNGFVSEASKEDMNNSHSVASYILVRNLSRLVFKEEFVSDLKQWKGKRKQISQYALQLYDSYPNGTEI